MDRSRPRSKELQRRPDETAAAWHDRLKQFDNGELPLDESSLLAYMLRAAAKAVQEERAGGSASAGD